MPNSSNLPSFLLLFWSKITLFGLISIYFCPQNKENFFWNFITLINTVGNIQIEAKHNRSKLLYLYFSFFFFFWLMRLLSLLVKIHCPPPASSCAHLGMRMKGGVEQRPPALCWADTEGEVAGAVVTRHCLGTFLVPCGLPTSSKASKPFSGLHYPQLTHSRLMIQKTVLSYKSAEPRRQGEEVAAHCRCLHLPP